MNPSSTENLTKPFSALYKGAIIFSKHLSTACFFFNLKSGYLSVQALGRKLSFVLIIKMAVA
jgi:hypothetical protein